MTEAAAMELAVRDQPDAVDRMSAAAPNEENPLRPASSSDQTALDQPATSEKVGTEGPAEAVAARGDASSLSDAPPLDETSASYREPADMPEIGQVIQSPSEQTAAPTRGQAALPRTDREVVSSRPAIETSMPGQASESGQPGADAGEPAATNGGERAATNAGEPAATSAASEPQSGAGASFDAPQLALLQELAAADRQLASVLRDEPSVARRQTIREISRTKLDSSRQLIALSAANSPAWELGQLGQIEALSQLAGIEDQNAVRDLYEIIGDMAAVNSPRLTHRANAILLGFVIPAASDREGGENVVERANEVLSNRQLLTATDAAAIGRAIQRLHELEMPEAAERLRQDAIAAFDGVDDPLLAADAFALLISGEKGLEAILQICATDPLDTAALQRTVYEWLQHYPSQWALNYLTSLLPPLQTEGQWAAVDSLTAILQSRQSTIENAQLAAAIEAVVEAARYRIGLIGKAFPLDELVGLDGQPVDLPAGPLLIELWDSTCAPCRVALRDLADIENPAATVITVNLDSQSRSLPENVADASNDWVQARPRMEAGDSPYRSTLADYLRLQSVPFNLILDADHKIRDMQLYGQRLRKVIQ